MTDPKFEALFRRLFELYFSPLKSHARHITGSNSTAEDIVQDAFVRLWEMRDTFDFDRSVKTWLYQAVHNQAINHLRHLQVEERFRETVQLKIREAELFDPASGEQQPDLLYQEEFNKSLKLAIDRMPGRCRETFLLSRQSGLTYRQIAGKMGITPKAVERNMTRALSYLREALRGYLPVALLIRLLQ